jgi:hypothetical protein
LRRIKAARVRVSFLQKIDREGHKKGRESDFHRFAFSSVKLRG